MFLSKFKGTYLFILFILINYLIYSQPDLNFQRYTAKQGLVHNDVLSICQDQFGFIWFGTKGGISRFDGMKFNHYLYGENDNDWITCILNDNYDRLWFGIAGDGSNFLQYDYKKDCFIDMMPVLEPTLDSLVKSTDIWNLYADIDGCIWIAKGIRYYDPQLDEVVTLKTEISASSYMQDSNDLIWISVENKGLLSYNKKTEEFNTFFYNAKSENSIPTDKCRFVFEDSEGCFWIGGRDGLVKMELSYNEAPVYTHFKNNPDNPNSLSSNNVYDVIEYDKNNLLIATVNGLCILNKNSQKIYRYFNDELEALSINSNLVHKIFKDKDGNIWIATNQGIGKLQKKNFRSFSHSNYKNSISHNKIQDIFEAPNGEIWLATPKGIDIYNRGSNQFRFRAGITKDSNGLFGAPLVFAGNKNSGIWAGTWNGAFSYFDLKNISITNFYTRPDLPSNLKTIFTMVLGHNNVIWVSTSGIYKYDPMKNIYKNYGHIDGVDNSIISPRVRVIMEDSDNEIWAGTTEGLSILKDQDKGIFKHYFKGTTITNVVESKNKEFWLSTPDGVYKFNKNTGKIKHYGSEIGIKGSVFGILEDGQKNLWISTSKGFGKLIFKNDSTVKYTTYKEEEGIDIGDFLPRSCCKLADGTMLFGGTKGFCMFKPEEVVYDTIVASVIFTDLRIGKNYIKAGQEINKQVILEKSFPYTKQITLNYKNNAFAIEFTGIQYNMSQYNQYAYKLEGLDKNTDWNYTTASDRKVEYMNIPSGEYTFKVKASNSYGIWNEKIRQLNITILPPWWKTWWFRTGTLLFIILAIFSFYFYRINALKARQRYLEQKVAERTQELRNANSELEEKQEEIMQQNEEILSINNELTVSKRNIEKAYSNIKVLSEFGQKLTATFDFDAINIMIYEYVSSLVDTAAFGIGLYNEKRKIIDFPYFMEQGKPVPYFFKALTSEKSLSVRCFKNSEEIVINDLSLEYRKYLAELPEVQTSRLPASVIHLPLTIENRPIGIITVNSFNKNAFSDNDITNLRTLASYISIALDNSKAYRIIRTKNEQISGSIRYGQTIQQAMLPPKEQMDKVFENFILFRPKDIVSGDFYWFVTVHNLEGFEMESKPMHFLAVVDCTGHGVPGAFMSMIGSRLLNDIVIERKIYSPANILDLLNNMIRKALRQNTTDNHDGMDVCLCRFRQNKNGMELTYAGAKRPLMFYCPESKKIEEIQGTRRSIGGVASRKITIDFSEETLYVNHDYVFYLSTDGLIDQCNPQKIKFSQKKLNDLLLHIHMKPVADQKIKIENELDKYQQAYEQRDDITLVGLKLK